MILATRTRRARRAGRCPLCQTAIQRGQPIALLGASWTHARCAASRIRDGTSRLDSVQPNDAHPEPKGQPLMTTTTRAPARWFDLARHGDDEQDEQPAALDYDSYLTAGGQLDRARLVRDLAAAIPATETEPAEADPVDYRTADRTTVDAEIARIRNH